MDRWLGILKVSLGPESTASCRIAASLCISPSKTLLVPTANAIFFNGDLVEGTGNPVIERLSDIQHIAEILGSKLGPSINTWVIEASTFNGPFAVYKEFIHSLNRWGEPQSYSPNGYPASTSVVALLSNFLLEREKNVTKKERQISAEQASNCVPRTILLGFSKGGVVLNQLVTELGSSEPTRGMEDSQQPASLSKITGNQIIPVSRESFFDSLTEIHYVDVGLNCPGAYPIDDAVFQRIAEQLSFRERELRFVLHGTPRQWSDISRPWIREEKDKFRQLLNSGGQTSNGRLEVCEKTYFAESIPDLQMHFEIIEKLILS